MTRLLMLCRPIWLWLAAGALSGLIALVANVLLMGTSGWFIAAMAVAGTSGGTMDYFTPAALIRFCAILRTAGRYAERLLTHEATLRLMASLRVWFFEQLEPQPPTVLEAYHSGDLGDRLRIDIDRLENAYLRVAEPTAVAVAGTALVLAWLGHYAPSFAAIEGTLLFAAGFGLPLVLTTITNRLGRRMVQTGAALSELAVDGLQGLAELQVFGRDQAHRLRFSALGDVLVDDQTRAGRLNGLSQAAMLAASNLALWGVIVAAQPLLRQHRLAPPDLVLVALAALAGFEAIAPMPAAFQALGAVHESARRLFSLVSGPPLTEKPSTISCERCDIRLQGLSFTYPGATTAAISGFDLHLPPGRKVALVGPAGSGKSTLILLLSGLLQPTAGTILLNGRPLAEHDLRSLGHLLAVSPQNAGLFTGTVRDNLCLGDANATDEQLWSVLAQVKLDTWIADLKGGLDCWLGEAGQTLSGGQMRRLSIARALLRPAPVLILDEPGEGLDLKTEREMLQSIVSALSERTLLLITHRPTGLDLMDDVVRMRCP
jgi:ATP-binding cassette subfamily C protein CydC